MKDTVKLSLHVSPELNELLDYMSEATHSSKSDVLRKSIALMKVAVDSKAQGQSLGIVNKKHELVREIVGL